MKIAIVMSFFVVMSFSLFAEDIDQIEKKEDKKADRTERNISKDINRREAKENRKSEIEVKEQSENINQVEENENEMITDDTPADERDPGEAGEDSTKPDSFIPDEMEQDIKKEENNDTIEPKEEIND